MPKPGRDGSSILVIGGTGRCGRPVSLNLLAREFSVRVMTRDPSGDVARELASCGAELVRGDLLDAESLTGLLDGVSGIYLITTPGAGLDEEVRAGRNAVRWAASRGDHIAHFVFQSVLYAETPIPHCRTKRVIENALEATELPYTILRPAIFLEILLKLLYDPRKVLPISVRPEVKCPWISVQDIGRAALKVFTRAEPRRRRYDLLAMERVSYEEIARILSRWRGHEVQFVYKTSSMREYFLSNYDEEVAERYIRRTEKPEEDYYEAINRGVVPGDALSFPEEMGIRFCEAREFLREALRLRGTTPSPGSDDPAEALTPAARSSQD